MKPALTLLLALAAAAHAQGPLAPPPGAPAPVMKSLDQIEARTPLVAGQPGVSIDPATGTITIHQPGSYYLTKNTTMASASANGIQISSHNVALDLNGFTLICTGVSGATAIKISDGVTGIRLRNGSIYGGPLATGAGWEHGISGGIGSGSSSIQVSGMTINGIRQSGIFLSTTSSAQFASGTVETCVISNVGSNAITARFVTNCMVTSSGGGISAIDGIVSGCVCEASGDAILASNGLVSGSRGISSSSKGISSGAVIDSQGTGNNYEGIEAEIALNSTGRSTSGIGLLSRIATNCTGFSASGSYGLFASGTATNCRGTRPGGTAISAGIAIGCTSGGGTISSAQKHLGTP